jgi:hypothetical protein
MATGIGVLCARAPQPKDPGPDAIVLLCHSSERSITDPASQTFVFPDEKLFAISVGPIERATELVTEIRTEFQSLQTRNLSALTETINNVVYRHRARHFQVDEMSKHYQFPSELSEYQHRELSEAWRRYDVGAHLLLATFDDTGHAVMYLIARLEYPHGWVHHVRQPGFATIGFGAHAASFWLNYRQQRWDFPVRQSAYHAYEAGRIVSNAANHPIESVIATNEGAFHLSHESPKLSKCPVSLLELKSMFAGYGPRDTQSLGESESLSEPRKRSKLRSSGR